MEIDFIHPKDKQWEAYLSQVEHDFYHLPGYLALCAQNEGTQAEALLITDGENSLFIPYLLEELNDIYFSTEGPLKLQDIHSPYGYPGPLIHACDKAFLTRALNSWIHAMQQRGIVSAFIRMHPLFVQELNSLRMLGNLVERGETVSVNLTLSPQAMWQQTEHGHRQRINKARRAGMQISLTNQDHNFEVFKRLYYETMDRLKANTYYYFSDSYFHELANVLGKRLWVCIVKDADEKAVSAGLFTECNRIVQFHLSGSSGAALKQSPSVFMLDYMRKWARERDNKLLHLGGGLSAKADSLFRFKAGFSKSRHVFSTWHIIFDEAIYRELVNVRLKQQGGSVDDAFFPAYRA